MMKKFFSASILFLMLFNLLMPDRYALAGMGFIGDGSLRYMKTITTDASATPTTSHFVVPYGMDAIRIWTSEVSVTQPWYDLYIRKNGGTPYVVRIYAFTGRILPVTAGDTISLGTSSSRSVYVSGMDTPAALITPSGVSGTANADHAGPPFWSPTAPHVTLPDRNSAFGINTDGTERIVFISEYTGQDWTPVRFFRLPASLPVPVKVQCTFNKIALATYEGTSLSIVAPTGSVVGGTSVAMAFTQTATGSTCNVSNNTEWNACVAASVAGDEIVISAGFTVGSNVTDSSWTANELAGRQGAEGIIIRSATGNPADVTLVLANNINGWALQQVGATQYTFIKGITFNLAGRAAFLNNQGGKFRYQDVRITGNSTSTTSPSLSMDSAQGAITFDAIRVQVDDCVEDCFDSNGTGSDSGSTSVIRLADCTGFDAGTTNNNQQVVTTHNGQRVQVWGGVFYDARAAVIENDSNATSITHLFFTYTHAGAAGRHGLTGGSSYYFTRNDSSAIDQFTMKAGGSSYSIGAHVTRTANISTSALYRITTGYDPTNSPMVANWVELNTGRAFHPSLGGGTYEYNVVKDAAEGFRINDATGVQASSTFRYNTMYQNATAFSMGDSDMVCTVTTSITRSSTNSVAGVTAGAVASSITSSYNQFDATFDTDWPSGTGDVTNADAQFDTTSYFPTDGGNVDLAGPTTETIVGRIDIWGFVQSYKIGVISKGARNIAEIISGAQVYPDLYI